MARAITEAIGDEWITDLTQLQQLKPLAADAGFQESFRAKREAKAQFADWLNLAPARWWTRKRSSIARSLPTWTKPFGNRGLSTVNLGVSCNAFCSMPTVEFTTRARLVLMKSTTSDVRQLSEGAVRIIFKYWLTGVTIVIT